MSFVCDHEGCDRGIATGHALHRVSPKPGPFVGLCGDHFAGTPDPVAQAIEDSNQRARPSREPDLTKEETT